MPSFLLLARELAKREGGIGGRERTCLAIAGKVGGIRYGLYMLILLQLVGWLVG